MELSTAKSMFYFARDAACILATQFAIASIRAAPTFQAVAWPLQLLALLPLQFLGGFFMWCMFVVGHDCGHTTFSQFQVAFCPRRHETRDSQLNLLGVVVETMR